MIYISGPITGNPNYLELFSDAEIQLNQVGYTTYNPAADPLNILNVTADREHQFYMRRDIDILLHGADRKKCEGIALLPGWEHSAGAYVEFEVAKAIGLPIKTVQGWINDGGGQHTDPDTTHFAVVTKPPQPAAHYRIDGAEVTPLVPPYQVPGDYEIIDLTDTDVVNPIDIHHFAERKPPACKHQWLTSETVDGLVKECPNCGETEIER